MKTAYDKNDTMRMLGYQYAMEILCREKVWEDMDNIAKARPYEATKTIAIDYFMLGYIYGKRAERSRRKRF